MYRNYVFDLYGTLVDIHTDENNEMVWEKLSLFYGYYGASYQPKELKDSYMRLVREAERDCGNMELISGSSKGHEGNPEIQIETVFEKLFTGKGVQPMDGLVLHTGQFFRALATEYIRLYEGVPEMLGKLAKKGKKIYLLSNAQRIFTEYELNMLAIAKYFDGIMISSDYGVKKPDIRFFMALMEKYHLKPEESIMIGNDKSCDIAGGKQIGMDTYYIHSNLSPEDTKDVDASYIQMEMDMKRVCRTLGLY